MNPVRYGDTWCLRGVQDYFPQYHADTINFYYTPPHSQGLPLHSDGYDIQVVQLFGRKHWTVIQEQFWLEPGDTFLLPRGTPHRCHTENEPSGHLALGSPQF